MFAIEEARCPLRIEGPIGEPEKRSSATVAAQRALQEGVVSLERVPVGIVYDRVGYAVSSSRKEPLVWEERMVLIPSKALEVEEVPSPLSNDPVRETLVGIAQALSSQLTELEFRRNQKMLSTISLISALSNEQMKLRIISALNGIRKEKMDALKSYVLQNKSFRVIVADLVALARESKLGASSNY